MINIVRRTALVTLLAVVVLSTIATPARAEVVAPTLVRLTKTSQWSPPSPDPMGIAYRASTNTLLIADSEVEETVSGITLWQGVNVWETSLTGAVQKTQATWPAFSSEPTDVAVNPSDGHVFFSDDDADKIWEVKLGTSGLVGKSDETVTSFSTRTFPLAVDPEGLAYGAGSLFIADGAGTEIWRVQPGPNGRFDGPPPGGDDVLSHFDTAALGQNDPEAVEYNPDAGTLFVGSRKTKIVAEVTLGGSLIRTYDLSGAATFKNSSGIAYAPTSNDPSSRSLYIVDRGVDNNTTPTENDGQLFEFRVGSGPPPTNNPPVVTNPGSQSTNEGAVVSLQVVASDADGDPLSYSASGLPPGLSINSSTGLISGTVSAGAASGSPYASSVTASDGSASDTAAFSWTIGVPPPTNKPPVVTNPGPQSTNEGGSVSLQVVASDPNGDVLSYSASGLPPGLSINSSTGLISGTVSAGAASGSPYSSQVGASDGSLADTKTFTWAVNGPPSVPTGLVMNRQTNGLFLDWNDNTDADLAGYNVYRSASANGSFTKLNGSLLSASSYLDVVAPTNAVSYYQVTAVDTGGLESVPASVNGRRGVIVLVGVASGHGRAASLMIAKPTGAAAGDVLLAAVAVRGAPTVSPPAGWTLVQDQTTAASASRQVLYWHVAGSSEPSSYTFTLGSRQGFVGIISAYRGVGAIDVSGGQANASSTAITAPSVTAAAGESVEVGFFGTAVFASIAPPTGMVEQAEDARSAGASSTRVTMETADDVVDAGILGALSAQASAAAANVGQVIVLNPTP